MGRFSCLADGPSVIDENIRETAPSVLWEQFFDIFFNFVRVLILRKSKPDAKPFDMGINHDTGNTKGSAQDAIRRLSTHPRQFDQFLHCGWDLATIMIYQPLSAAL